MLWVDLNQDGFPDVYVANDLTANALYENVNGTLTPISWLSGAAVNASGKAEAGMGLAVGDVDSDQDPDLIVSNFDVETNTLYRNDGQFNFQDVSAPSGFGPPSFNHLGFGMALEDFNADGALDAYVTNGHIFTNPRRETSPHGLHQRHRSSLLGESSRRSRFSRCGL